jgi:hypothetical protein
VRWVVTLLARDEIDVIASTIEHYLAAGAVHIVATDNGSVDGTTELLERYRDSGVLDLLHQSAHDYRQSEWVTEMARRAATHHGANWVYNADADDFCWPAEQADGVDFQLSDLLAEVPADRGTLTLRRDNLLASPTLSGSWPERLIWRDLTSVSERGTRIAAKVLHRGDPEVAVAQGNHQAVGPLIGPVYEPSPMVVIHVPDRSFPQYRQKIANGGSAYAANLDLAEDIGWHWRADYRRLRQGRLAETWAARQLTGEALAAGRSAGSIVAFPQLRQRLTALLPRAVHPDALNEVIMGSRRPGGY